MTGRLSGHRALVTGGARGIGRAIALTLAREGASVGISYLTSSVAARKVAAGIRSAGVGASAIRADVTREADVKRLVAAARERLGRLDILHNNVGASLALGDASATELTEEAYDRSLAVNLKATWLTCKHALPALRERNGSIVNIASMAARNAYPLVGYKTTKAAVVALTENLAAHNAQYGVRANSILPGLMNTPMAIESRVAAGTPREDVIASRDRRVPLGRHPHRNAHRRPPRHGPRHRRGVERGGGGGSRPLPAAGRLRCAARPACRRPRRQPRRIAAAERRARGALATRESRARRGEPGRSPPA